MDFVVSCFILIFFIGDSMSYALHSAYFSCFLAGQFHCIYFGEWRLRFVKRKHCNSRVQRNKLASPPSPRLASATESRPRPKAICGCSEEFQYLPELNLALTALKNLLPSGLLGGETLQKYPVKPSPASPSQAC